MDHGRKCHVHPGHLWAAVVMFGNAVIQYQGSDPQTVLVMPLDMVVWERSQKRKIGDGKGMGFEDMARLTYLSLKRQQLLPGGDDPVPFDKWIESLADYSPLTGPESDPSQPVAETPSG